MGIPLVLIHGIPTSSRLWRHVVPRIEGARCLAWEMAGYGASIPEGNNRNISVARQANYLTAWLKHLGIGRAILAGHDLGGGVAQIVAVRDRELCAGLFLTNSIGYDSWPIPSVKALRIMGGVIRHMPNAALKLLLSNLFLRGHDNSDRAREALEVHIAAYQENDGAAALVRQVKALDVHDTLTIAGMLPNIGLPARVVWGEADQFQKVHYGERLAQDLNAPLRRIPGGKHFTAEDHPEIIAEEINILIAEVQQAASGQG